MDILDLKAKLVEQHKRDKRHTLLLDVLLFMIVLVIALSLTSYFFLLSHIYTLLIGMTLVVGFVVYLIFKLFKINNREKQIERFIDKIKAGDKVIDTREINTYKIKLLKSGFFPVTYISLAFNTNPTKYYTFPVDKTSVQNLKLILDQANADTISLAQKEFLNADLAKDLKSERITLKNVDDFIDFLYKNLQFSLKDIQQRRKIPKFMLVIATILLAVVAIGWLYYMYILLFDSRADLLSSPYEMLIVIGLFFAVFYATYFLYFQPEEDTMIFDENNSVDSNITTADFKDKILTQVVEYINPQARYIMNGHIDHELIMKSGLFKNKNYQIYGNDLIIGKYNGVRFQFSDLLITHKSLFADQESKPNIVFEGQFFMARLRKIFPTPIYLVVRKARVIPHGLNNISGSEIELDDKEFMKLFQIYAPNTNYAEGVLTPIFREGLKRVMKRIPGDYYISFCEDLLTVANNSGKDSFEIEYSSSLIENDYEILIEFFKELYGDFIIIDDLRLKDLV